jgi:hypothetical protein
LAGFHEATSISPLHGRKTTETRDFHPAEDSMKKDIFAPFILLILAGCTNTGDSSKETSAKQPDAGAPQVAKKETRDEDCGKALKLCLDTVAATKRNLELVASVRATCNLEPKTFVLDSKDQVAIEAMGKNPSKCSDELKPCEEIRSRGIKLMQEAVKELDSCYSK